MRKGLNAFRVLLCWMLPGFLLVAGCSEQVKKVEEKAKYRIPDSLLAGIRIDTVRDCPYENVLKLTGVVDFDQDRQVNIFSLVSGNIQDIKVQLGDYVNAGQVLGVVKSSEMATYDNSLVVAETNLTSAKKQYDAQQEMYKAGLASALDLAAAKTAYDQAVAAVEMAKKILKINGNNEKGGDYVIKSPVSGFVVQKNVTNNTAVRPDNGNALFTISDLKNVWVQANVYEANIEKVHLGDQAEIKILSEPDRIFKGKVDKILNVLDPTTKVAKVRVILPNPDYVLKPQMFAGVMVYNATGKTAICVPASAVVYESSRYYVLVYNGKGDADIRPVDVLNTVGDKMYLKSGVNPGEKVVASMALQIYNELNN